MTSLRQIRSFAVLAEELHFGRAAKRLNIVQPALSMQIRALEEEIGTALFLRERKSVKLTRAGEVFLEDAVPVLGQIDAAVERVHETVEGRTGRLRIAGSATAYASGVAAPYIRTYLQHHPAVSLSAVEIHPLHQAKALLAGTIDIAFASQQLGDENAEAIIGQELTRFPYELAVSQSHPLAKRKRIHVDHLHEETLICLEGERDYAELNLIYGQLSLEPQRYLWASSPLSMLSLVDANLGVAVVSAALRKNALQGISFIGLDGISETMDVWMYRRANEQEKLVLQFFETTPWIGQERPIT